jgi:transposase
VSDKELIASLQKQISELLQRVSILEIRNIELERRNVELTAELAWYKSNRNSHNSHLPPSRDLHKPTPAKPKRKNSKRNPGGQYGHKANWLKKVDVADTVIVHDVAICHGCGEDLQELKGEIIRTA